MEITLGSSGKLQEHFPEFASLFFCDAMLAVMSESKESFHRPLGLKAFLL